MKPVRSLLIVEDDDDTRDSLRDYFILRGFVVHCAEDGRRALDLLDRLREPPACIVLDLDMPVMNGHEFMSRLRRQSGVPPVIILTGEDEEPPVGARYHFTKPPFLETLLRAVVSCSLR